MSFGVFEAAVGSEVEVGLAKQASVDKMAAAVYDVREKLGPILFASRDVEEFRHKVAMMKADQSVYKIINAHLMPLPKVIRDIVGKNSVLEREFSQRLADSGMTPGADDAVARNIATYQDPADSLGGLAPQDVGGTLPTPGMQPTAMRKGAPFAGYEDFDDCTSKNSDKGDSDAYCGEIKHRTEDKKESSRRRADFEGVQDIDDTFEDHQGEELKPKGDFDAYLNKMDQGAKQKVKRNFASKEAVNVYLSWCQSRNLSPARLSSLDHYATNMSTGDYFRLANVILAWEDEHHPKVPSTTLKAKDKVARGKNVTPLGTQPTKPDTNVYRSKGGDPWEQVPEEENWNPQHNNPNWHKAHADPMRPYLAWCQKHGLRYLSARNINHYAARDPQLAYFLAMRCKEAIKVARRRQAIPEPPPLPTPPGHNTPQGQRPVTDIINSLGDPADVMGNRQGRRRQAAPDYLQKADDALTQLLNQKAEEFQQTIAPLQQALITVQQAEQLQQQQNPLNVLPAPGTVNVMPGAPDSVAGQTGMPDPNQPDISAAVQALANPMGGGQAPAGDPGAGAPPPAAAPSGGLPPDLDPSQRAARRGKGRGATRPRQAAGVGELWDHWKSQRSDVGDALRGGDVDYDRFQNEHGVGDRAIQKLKKRNETPDFAPINGTGRGRSPQGVTVGRKQACWPGCHDNEAHAAKFHPKDKDKKESRRRQAGPQDLGPGYDNVQYDDFNSPAPGSPQAEYQHPGQAKGWKGQFAQEPQGPYDGEYYSKGRATVRGGPGPDVAKYWLNTPHGMHGPHHNVHDAFSAAEPFLAQDAEIGKGQGTLFDAPRAKGEGRPRSPLARRKRAEVPGGLDQGRHSIGDPDDNHPPILDPVSPYTGGSMFGDAPDFTPHAARRKQAWTGWGPSVFPKARKVGGWDWDEHLNGYLANSPRHFECSCGDQFPTPSGFQRCACGKQYNSYVIGTGGNSREASAEKFIVREVPVRPDVIVANRKMAGPVPHDQIWHAMSPEARERTEGPPGWRQKNPGFTPYEPKHNPNIDYETGKPKHWSAVQLVDKQGNIHNLIDPGEVDEGEDPKHPTFRKQPKDWARRSGDGKWTPNAIG